MQFERLGPYKIGKRLGRGGMGTVFAGVHVDTGESAAVKVLNPHVADDAGFRERFELEIDALKKLQHPNIVRMYGFGEQDGYLYYVMELVEGRSVEEELQTGRRFGWREVIQDAVKLCKALRHAHDHGIVHRDMKPANILLTPDGEVKLTDFGIARLFGNTRLTMEGGLVGTAEYMSPEQAAGERVTPLSDLYSLGGVMFAMLAGRPPFRTASLAEMLQKQRFEPPPPVARFASDVPAELEEAITRLLSKDPHLRAPNALVLSRQLAAMEHGLSRVRERTGADKTNVGSGPLQAADRTVSGKPIAPEDELVAPTQFVQSYSPPAIAPKPKDPTVAGSGSAAPSAAPASAVKSMSEESGSGDSAFVVDAQPELVEATTVENRFTTIEEDRRRSEELARASQQAAPIVQVAMLSLSLVAVLVLLWYLTRPPSADKLFGRIMAAAAEEDPAALAAEQDDVHSFLERFPDDPRAAEVKHYQSQIELEEMEKRFRIRARFPGRDDHLTPVELDYLEAMSYEAHDPQKAIDKLQALVNLYGSEAGASEHTTRCVELAKRQLQHLKKDFANTVLQRVEVLRDSLKRADSLRQSSPAEARAIWTSMVELYGDKSWAADAVAKAKAALAETKP